MPRRVENPPSHRRRSAKRQHLSLREQPIAWKRQAVGGSRMTPKGKIQSALHLFGAADVISVMVGQDHGDRTSALGAPVLNQLEKRLQLGILFRPGIHDQQLLVPGSEEDSE